MTSSRLAGKVLMDLGGRPVLEQMLRRVMRSKRLDIVAVATTVNATDDPVAELCDAMSISVFRGDELDVLGRFLGAAHDLGAETLVRLTGDCPMHDPAVIDLCVARFEAETCDYRSNVVPRTYPDGLDTEVFSLQALERTSREAKSEFWREHVTAYIREPDNRGSFQIASVVNDMDLSALRWTLDTTEDLVRLRRYFERLPDGFTWQEAVEISNGIEQVA